MSTITINDIDQSKTLSTEEQKAMQGGWYFNYTPYFAPYSPYAYGYGGFNNVFQRGSFGFGVQAGTFARQASWDTQNANWLANF